jgi:hypothetical protein
MSESDPPNQIDFEAPATFRKWPSLNGQRRIDSTGPYSLLDGTLDECIREFLAKPTVTRHLYEIHTSPQAPFVGAVVITENVAELAHLQEFLARAATVLTPYGPFHETREGRPG